MIPSTSVSLSATETRSDASQTALVSLFGAVYAPDELANWPGRHIEWVSPDWDVFVIDDQLGLASYTGAVLRDAKHDDRPVRPRSSNSTG